MYKLVNPALILHSFVYSILVYIKCLKETPDVSFTQYMCCVAYPYSDNNKRLCVQRIPGFACVCVFVEKQTQIVPSPYCLALACSHAKTPVEKKKMGK